MPENHTLFIVASNEFLDRFLDDRRGEVIPLTTSTLIGLEEPVGKNPWGEKLQKSILKKIEEHRSRPGLRVIVAGHISTCFGMEGARQERDRPMPDKAEALKASAGGDLEVQVWGFHHETDWSRIWAALVNVHEVIGVAATDEQKRAFEERLLDAFKRSGVEDTAALQSDQNWESHERLSVIAHNIMGRFNPLRLKLEAAAARAVAASATNDPESRETANKKVERLRSDVNGLLSERLKSARALLNEAAGLTRGGENNECWKRAAAKLDKPPSTDPEAFWKWMDELHDILKNLVQ